jgi:hypothetical protein
MTATTLPAARAEGRRFYVLMALAFVLIAFGGFIPTYWAKLADGSFGGNPILHVHGALFFGWTLFFLVQTSLVAAGRTIDHRAWGLAGISLATAMGFTIVLAAINSIKAAELIGMGDGARRFMIVSMLGLVCFAAFFALAIVNNRQAETHKRLMILAMIPLMHAATARVFALFLTPPGAVGPPPVFVSVPPGLLVDLLLVVAMVHDWRTLGRPHKVYLIGLPVLIAVQVLSVPLSATPGWMAIARAVEGLAG